MVLVNYNNLQNSVWIQKSIKTLMSQLYQIEVLAKLNVIAL